MEKLAKPATEALQEDYLNPLSQLLDAPEVYKISSGVPVEDSIQVLRLLYLRQAGNELRDCFVHDRLISGVTSFNSLIKRNNLNLFINTGRTAKMKIGRETSILEVNRNIIANISWSVESGKTVDFKETLR